MCPSAGTKPVACRQSSFSATGRNAWEESYYRFLFYCIYNFLSIIVNENFEPGFLAFTFSVLSAFKRA